MMTHSLYKTDWELDPSLHNTRPGVGSTPQHGYVPPRRVWFSAVFAHYGLKLSMIFEEATALNKLIYLFNSKQLQMDTKERKINEIYHSN